MKRSAILAAVLGVSLVAQPATAGDKILRFGPNFVEPTASLARVDSGREIFDDPLDPLVGMFDVVQRTEGGVGGAPGFGLGFEYKLSERIGIDTSLAYSRHDFRLDFSGEITWTPWVEELGAHDLEQSETAPIIGAGAGHVTLGVLTVGVNFHPLRHERLDLYFGPLAGVSYSETEFDSGRFTASFSDFTSVTPLDRRESDQQAELVYGAALGVDVPVGEKGWLVSTVVSYLETEMEVDPWTVQVGLGHRF